MQNKLRKYFKFYSQILLLCKTIWTKSFIANQIQTLNCILPQDELKMNSNFVAAIRCLMLLPSPGSDMKQNIGKAESGAFYKINFKFFASELLRTNKPDCTVKKSTFFHEILLDIHLTFPRSLYTFPKPY